MPNINILKYFPIKFLLILSIFSNMFKKLKIGTSKKNSKSYVQFKILNEKKSTQVTKLKKTKQKIKMFYFPLQV